MPSSRQGDLFAADALAGTVQVRPMCRAVPTVVGSRRLQGPVVAQM